MTYWEYSAAVTTISSNSEDEDSDDMPDFETMKQGLMVMQESEAMH